MQATPQGYRRLSVPLHILSLAYPSTQRAFPFPERSIIPGASADKLSPTNPDNSIRTRSNWYDTPRVVARKRSGKVYRSRLGTPQSYAYITQVEDKSEEEEGNASWELI